MELSGQLPAPAELPSKKDFLVAIEPGILRAGDPAWTLRRPENISCALTNIDKQIILPSSA
jgi:hypothetical protein